MILILHNIGTNTITLQDDSILAGSDIFLGGAEGTLKVAGAMILSYSSNAPSGWVVISNPNTAAVGASAKLLAVRNTSGSSIAAGKPVYIAGWNSGQLRFLIDLADANDSAKMPAIGITAEVIATGSNGDVILAGTSTGVIDTSAGSIGGGVWVGTTAGGLVFTRPTVDEIQRIGTIARANASGVVIVTGAGRTNDVPISIPRVKGGDLTSASPLVIDTDGDYFDVTGTTNFAAMTVAKNRHFFLQFDGILTMTHHATNLDLPGEANITTAAGDVGEFFSTGANTVQCVSYTLADGRAVVSISNEEIQDVAGPLVATGGTKTGIAVTYQDGTNDIDFVVVNAAALGNLSGTNTGDEPTASTTIPGIVERATDAEASAGSDTSRYITSKHLGDAPVGFTLGTEQSTSSGSSVTFGSIPAGTTMIVINFEDVSFTAGVNLDVTIGDGGGLETFGYVSTTAILDNGPGIAVSGSTSEFIVRTSSTADNIISGQMLLTLKDSSNFTWVSSHNLKASASTVIVGGGHKSLSAELTQLRISGGTFDAGSINIMYQ